ncbi:hypothetical protein JG688_00009590 [Phytophthora aleatoria]|uniref:Telomeric single stranded DNA binding POT1/Cdc13 domain-containing protein n=1 Tax=Phytophthora aleatoria TaxID=2496075 RepID=A0A8J5IR91_9STRA|nr:hypothetical protein JG688_00009590 [Phytophthora aleatoria]
MELVSGERVVNGSVKRAYPLQSLRSASGDGPAASPGGGELGTFGPGVGPCGPDASQLVAITSCLVFFYDKWATKMQSLKRHYKVQVKGRGLVALEWEAGAETEERVQCIVVAERNVLKKTLDRQPRFFTFPHSLHIEIAYEEPQRLPESDQLRYLPSKTVTTRDLHSDGYADIYGVIINVTLPKKTSGRDFCMTVSVTDESCPTRAAAIQINIFYPSIAKMPKIKTPRNTASCSPRGERTWARKSLAEDDTLPQGCALAPKLLSELKFAEGFIDLVVRVLNLDDSDEPVRLTVWDGSGNAADSDRSLVRALQDKGAAVPPYGLLKEVIMSSCWPVVREMGFVEGMLTNWCRFRNLAVGVDEPIPGAAVAPGGREILRFREVTSFVLMPDFALDVKRRCSLTNRPNSSTTANDDQIRAAEENLVSPVEVATVIPDRIQKKIPVTPLCEILSSSQTPRKFHCCARVRSIWPTDIEKICKPKPGSDCEFIYSFALTVEEGSNSMNIIVYGKDAEHFLHGIPPCDLSKSTSSKTLLKKRFAALLKSPNAFHWCIKSYSVSLPPGRSADPGTAVRHRLFDTLLQCS